MDALRNQLSRFDDVANKFAYAAEAASREARGLPTPIGLETAPHGPYIKHLVYLILARYPSARINSEWVEKMADDVRYYFIIQRTYSTIEELDAVSKDYGEKLEKFHSWLQNPTPPASFADDSDDDW